jgi:hypothetical protein
MEIEMFNPDTRDAKLGPCCYVVEELELHDYPTVMVMEATLHLDIDQWNDWYLDFITIEGAKGFERLQPESWLETAIRRTVNQSPKLHQSIYDFCVEHGS